MFWKVTRPVIRAVNILSILLVAGMYVFTYYDYLNTIVVSDGVPVFSDEQPRYANGQLGIVTVNQQIFPNR